MNSTIKALEKIGQNTSLKQYDNLPDMLKTMNISENSLDDVNLDKKEFVCALLVPKV